MKAEQQLKGANQVKANQQLKGFEQLSRLPL
jgi:hypothetical protein